MEEITIVLLEDNRADAALIRAILESEWKKFKLVEVDSEKGFLAALKDAKPDLVISDFSLPSYDGKKALAATQRIAPETPFIFYSGTLGEESAIEALKNGASDYVIKDRPRRLVPAIRRALDEAKQKAIRKNAEKRITSLAHMMDLAPDAIIVRDVEGRVLSWNKGAERLYGFTINEVETEGVTDLIYRWPASDHEDAKKKVLSEGHWEGELEQITKDKRTVVVLSRWTLVRGENRETDQILIINTDITEKKLLERQFLRAQRLESIGILASGIAHDLNNILAPILMCSELLKADESRPDALALLDSIIASARRGGDTVKQVLTFVRGSEGKRLPIKLAQVMQEVCKVITDTFPKNIEVSQQLDPKLWHVCGDATQLHQVLMNLSINARDAMPNGGKLVFSARNLVDDEGGQKVFLQVKDTGTGIPAEIQERIFDPFFTTKEAGKGTGLGLSTVLGIVKSHTGTLRVQSIPGKGTSFEMTFPAIAVKEKTGLNGQTTSLRGHGELILLVDDESEIRRTVSQVLAQYGYEVRTAEDGAAAVVQFEEIKENLKLIITDLMMPGVQGSSLAQTLTTIKPGVRILVTSGLPEESCIPGATCFLRKPFSMML